MHQSTGEKEFTEILERILENVEIIEAELCPHHIHMLYSIPPNIRVAQFAGYLKGKSALMIFDRHANLKYKCESRHFWCRGYYVDTVGKNEKKIVRIYTAAAARRYYGRPNKFERVHRPVHG